MLKEIIRKVDRAFEHQIAKDHVNTILEKQLADNKPAVKLDIPKSNRFIQGNDVMPPREVFQQ